MGWGGVGNTEPRPLAIVKALSPRAKQKKKKKQRIIDINVSPVRSSLSVLLGSSLTAIEHLLLLLLFLHRLGSY